MGRPAGTKGPVWDSSKLPNQGSKKATPASLKTDLWYRELQIWERWTWGRYVRLARFLSLTPEELASVVLLPHARLEVYQRENHIFNGHQPDRAVALLLTMLETHTMKHLTTDVVEQPMPDLTKQ